VIGEVNKQFLNDNFGLIFKGLSDKATNGIENRSLSRPPHC